jgi:hypothetical protein
MATWQWIKQRNIYVWQAVPPFNITGYEDQDGLAFMAFGNDAGLELRILSGEFWLESDPRWSLYAAQIPTKEGQKLTAAMKKNGWLRTKAQELFTAQLASLETTEVRERSAQLSQEWWNAL